MKKEQNIKAYVEQRYAHLPEMLQKILLEAYLKSAERDADAFEIDYGVEASRSDLSVTYKDDLYHDDRC
jgi:hypothetical protein